MENKHTMSDLYQMQSLPLSAKISMTARRIDEWVNEFGEYGVYLSFSGGKDSTVLGHIIREVCGYKNIPFVFVDVPTQYPELKKFAQTFDNLVILKPKISFAEVCEKYGFPLFGKEIANCIDGARRYVKCLDGKNNSNIISTDRQTVPYACYMADLLGIDRRVNKGNADYQSLQMGVIPSGSKYRLDRLNGVLLDNDGKKSQFNMEKYKFTLDASFDISDKCCDYLKKEPAHEYEKKTDRKPITATMAAESKVRTQKWLQDGCNAFDCKRPHSKPMSFWTDQDVLLYIKENAKSMIEVRMSDDKMFYGNRIVYKKTGASVEIPNFIFQYVLFMEMWLQIMKLWGNVKIRCHLRILGFLTKKYHC